MLKTIVNHRQVEFECEVNGLLDEGFKLSSSSCNTYQYRDFPEETYWTAILIKD